MKRNNLYETLKYIDNNYYKSNGQTEVNTYFDKNIVNFFKKYTYCPTIKLIKYDNYIDILFNGRFRYYLDTYEKTYTIRVFDNDKIEHNIPYNNRNLLIDILQYIENDFYDAAVEAHKKIMEAKEKEKEEIYMDSISPIIDKAKSILYNLGYVYRTDSLCDDNEPVTQSCQYTGYGLTITSYDLPGYVFRDSKANKLIPSIKKYMNKISVYYKNSKVFDSYDRVYEEGIWEDIFEELYQKTPILRQQKENEYQNLLHCVDFLNKVLKPLYYRSSGHINSSIQIGKYKKKNGNVNNCGSFEEDNHYYIKKDNIEVLHIVESDWDKYLLYKYIPGTWEQELEDYLIELDNKEKQQDIEDGYEYIRKLREL